MSARRLETACWSSDAAARGHPKIETSHKSFLRMLMTLMLIANTSQHHDWLTWLPDTSVRLALQCGWFFVVWTDIKPFTASLPLPWKWLPLLVSKYILSKLIERFFPLWVTWGPFATARCGETMFQCRRLIGRISSIELHYHRRSAGPCANHMGIVAI